MLDQSGACGCDRTSKSLMPLDAACELALSQVTPLTETKTLPLQESCGRVSAETIFAATSMPLFDNSAMDGFAVHTADCKTNTPLAISGTVAAGDAPATLMRGTAMRIFTGAPIPRGANAVVMVEDCSETRSSVSFRRIPSPNDNIRHAGSDQQEGAVLLEQGRVIRARTVGLLAANGVATCTVLRPVRVGIFSTGDELSSGALKPGQIHDANRPMLIALAAQMGAEVHDLGVLPDDLATTTEALVEIKNKYDLVLTSGAVSVGGRDHMRGALIAAGGTLQGWRVAIKPGKPVAFGRLGQTAITSLPGNPFAAFVGFHLFAGPQISRLSGATPKPFAFTPAQASFKWQRKPGRAEVFPVRLVKHDSNGCAILDRLGASVSATLFPLADADGIAIVSAQTSHVSPGDQLQWHPFPETGEMR